jgi:hypothetical protein
VWRWRAAPLLLACAAASVVCASCPQMIPLYPTSRISGAQIEDLISLAKMRPGNSCVAFGEHQIQCNASDLQIWWFTQDGHPAHPAASRSQMLTNEKTGETCLVRDGYFAGAKRPFASWLESLKAHDKDTARQMRQPLQPPTL